MEKYIKSEILNLRTHEEYNENWVKNRIVEDPSILNLGNLEVLTTEKSQPTGGRLDLLLYNDETNERFEVELQLGKTDESHIIRTIEYWDIERKRYPKYQHTAVIIAENITSRFLNVISLLNRSVPLIAIQFKAIKVEDKILLDFTTILDETLLRIDEIEEDREPASRQFWINKGLEKSMELADKIIEIVKEIDPKYSLNYTRHYVGLSKDGISDNFIYLTPKLYGIRLNIKRGPDDQIEKILEASKLNFNYNRSDIYTIKHMAEKEIDENRDILKDLIKIAYDYHSY